MREIFRRHLAPPAGSYLVWIARPPALDLPFEDLKTCMAELLRRTAPRP
jgi:RNase P protein component